MSKVAAAETIRKEQKEVLSKVRVGESEWQGKAARWQLYTAKRKVELEAREDDEAEGRPRRSERGGVNA